MILLHGRTDSAEKAFAELGLAEQARVSGFAIAAIDGASTYWTSYEGVDTGAMVIDDFLPLLESKGLPTNRVGLTGYSMGGLGALLLAQRLGPQRVFAAAPMSAAVWEGGHPAAEGEAQAAVRRDVGKLAGTPVSIVCGEQDDLLGVNQSMAGLIPGSRVSWTPGGHDFSYWGPALEKQLAWMGSLQPEA